MSRGKDLPWRCINLVEVFDFCIKQWTNWRRFAGDEFTWRTTSCHKQPCLKACFHNDPHCYIIWTFSSHPIEAPLSLEQFVILHTGCTTVRTKYISWYPWKTSLQTASRQSQLNESIDAFNLVGNSSHLMYHNS